LKTICVISKATFAWTGAGASVPEEAANWVSAAG